LPSWNWTPPQAPTTSFVASPPSLTEARSLCPIWQELFLLRTPSSYLARAATAAVLQRLPPPTRARVWLGTLTLLSPTERSESSALPPSRSRSGLSLPARQLRSVSPFPGPPTTLAGVSRLRPIPVPSVWAPIGSTFPIRSPPIK